MTRKIVIFSGLDLGIKLCELLGFDTAITSEINVSITPDKPVTVTASTVLEDDKVETFLSALKEQEFE